MTLKELFQCSWGDSSDFRVGLYMLSVKYLQSFRAISSFKTLRKWNIFFFIFFFGYENHIMWSTG